MVPRSYPITLGMFYMEFIRQFVGSVALAEVCTLLSSVVII